MPGLAPAPCLPHLEAMTRLPALALAAITVAAPASAQDEDAGSLFQRGFDMMLRNFMQEGGPQVDDLSAALDRMAPVLQHLAVMVDDLRNYHPPKRLENGDIVIRRRDDAPPPPPLGEGLDGLTEDPPARPFPIDPGAPQIPL